MQCLFASYLVQVPANADLSGYNLQGLDLTKPRHREQHFLYGVDLTSANLSGAYIEELEAKDLFCRASGMVVQDTDLRDINGGGMLLLKAAYVHRIKNPNAMRWLTWLEENGAILGHLEDGV